jgi:hypothetical protein
LVEEGDAHESTAEGGEEAEGGDGGGGIAGESHETAAPGVEGL